MNKPLQDIRSERQAIRRELRQRRMALSAAQRRVADAAICRALLHSRVWQRSRRVALFLPHRGEPDLRPLLADGLRRGKRLCLPVLKPFGERGLWFRETRRDEPLTHNRFGIPEPGPAARRFRPRELDLILTPLVAFDGAGNRLGMGAGFYDRTFAFLRRQPRWGRPLLLGVAFGFQEHPALPAADWDVPLHGVLTEDGLRRIR